MMMILIELQMELELRAHIIIHK
ncbi:uncharacterized protein METZ01_LOCUS268127 [marine metagenome]|uniref:Uncharacterized protein n=1 Tax=marine metagenome TaxID=408172 RepID=A0A382JVM9_9ZZZZ